MEDDQLINEVEKFRTEATTHLPPSPGGAFRHSTSHLNILKFLHEIYEINMSNYPLIGITLQNRYKIDQRLGSGGFGDTYLAVDLNLMGAACVVKHLKPKNPDPAILAIAKARFEREAQNLYRLGNENNQIPRLFAHFEENGEFYLVQEFIDGHDLTREITLGSPKSEKVVFKLLKDILEVLVFVHHYMKADSELRVFF